MATIIELPLISAEGVVMSPDIPCQHCGRAVMYSERSEAWLAFAWYGGVLSNICPGVESGHSPEVAA